MTGDKDNAYQYQPLWGKWYIELPLGQGSFGTVYKITCEEMGYHYDSAVKVITIPSEEQYRDAKASLGDDEDTLTGYFEDIVRNIVGEINMLYSLSGNSNIVGYQDHQVIKKKDTMGWDVLIRMELVTSLPKYLESHRFSREQVIQLGLDICTALELCSKKGIIHRDIKDENIFISKDGLFKLGDFGIAKELSGTGRAASMRGTPLYMAPEVYRGEKYDAAVDIYSLGIVLYKLLNGGRMPFMPPYPQQVKSRDCDDALERRIAGEQLPPPTFAGELLSSIVLKACAHNPKERYASAMEMRQAIEWVLTSMSDTERAEFVTPEKARKTEPTEPTEKQTTETERKAYTPQVERTIGILEKGADFSGALPQQPRENVERTIGVADVLEQSAVRTTDRPLYPDAKKARENAFERHESKNDEQNQGVKAASGSAGLMTDMEDFQNVSKIKGIKKILLIIKIIMSVLLLITLSRSMLSTFFVPLIIIQLLLVIVFRNRPKRGDIINIVLDIIILTLLSISGCVATSASPEYGTLQSDYNLYDGVYRVFCFILLVCHLIVSIISLKLESK